MGGYFTAIALSGGITTSAVQTECSGCGINANGIQIKWQTTDTAILKLLASGTPPTTTATTGSSNSSLTGLSTPTPPRGLPPGAKAGIGVSVAIVALLALLGSFFFGRRRRLRGTEHPIYTSTDPVTQVQYTKPELDASGSAAAPNPSTPNPNFQPAAIELYSLSPNNSANPATNPRSAMSSPLGPTQTATRAAHMDITPHPEQPVAAQATHQGVDETLALRREFERVRAERERLLRLQELSEVEERLRQRLAERERGSE